MQSSYRLQAACALFLALFVWAMASVYADGGDDAQHAEPDNDVMKRGAAIYAAQCAQCHGDRGQGVADEYDKPLIGDRSQAWLTRRIDRTMPEGKAELCVGEDAAAVAQYIYARFYSPEARAAAEQDARPTLQHLTVEQHRQSLADLVGSFRDSPPLGDERGLTVQYYAARNMREKPVAERVEPNADAVYTAEHPLHEKFDERGHSVRWSGSLLAPETGEYEIVVRTDHAFRLFLNDGQARGGGISNEMAEAEHAFIDGWVMSKDKEEFRKRVFLLAGRAYPLMLEFSSHTQGVGNEDWHKEKGAARSYLSLRWVMPGRGEQVIDQRYLSPVRSAEVFVASAAFPPDDASTGFARGAEISPAWLSAVTDAAVQTADHVVKHFHELAGTAIDKQDARERAMPLCHQLVERAFRRPLTDQEKAYYVDRHFEGQADVADAVKRVVLATLISPRFLYPDAVSDPQDNYAIAAKLALALRDGLPDQQLLDAAAKGRLTDPDTLRTHAERLSHDPRAEAKLHDFFHHWLELERAEQVDKDADRFPAFDRALLDDLRTSLDLFIEHTVFSDKSDYRELLLADYLFVNDRLAEVYGIAESETIGKTFERKRVPDEQRSGVITHPYLLTAFAYHNSTSPIHRGVFLTRNVIGRALNPPPNAISFDNAEFDPTLTMREKVTAFTRDSACMACHATINPLGFSLEHYDAIGRYRTTDQDKPVDAASDFTDDHGEVIRLKHARDVAEYAAASRLARRGFIRQLFQHTAKRGPIEFGHDALDRLESRFVQSEFHVRGLFVEIAVYTSLPGQAEARTEPADTAKPQDDQP